MLGSELSKQQQPSDWGAEALTERSSPMRRPTCCTCALKEKLDAILARDGEAEFAVACFRFLPDQVRLDLAGWAAEDIFAHS